MHALDLGGMQISLLRLATSLADRGHKVWMVVQKRGGQLESQLPANIEVIDLKVKRTITSFLPLLGFLRERKPDFVLSGQLHINVMMVAAARLMPGRVRTIVTEHAPPLPLITVNAGWRYRVLPTLITRLYPHADAIVAVSEGVKRELQTLLPPGTRVDVIHNPVTPPDLERLVALPNDDPWFAPGAPPMVLGVGRLAPEKRFDLLLRSFAAATKRQPANLMILGEGPERDNLGRLAASLGIQDRLRLVGFKPNPFSYMKRAAVLVVTSDFEGFGNVLVEAMACGTPVISADCPFGPREILEDGRYGRLVPMGDERAFADAIVETLASTPDRANLHDRAQMFSVERSVRLYAGIMWDLVTRDGKVRASNALAAGGRSNTSETVHISQGSASNMGGEAVLDSSDGHGLASPSRVRVAFYMHDLSGGGVEKMKLGLLPLLVDAGLDVSLLLHSKSGDLLKAVPAGLPIVGFETRRTLHDFFPLWRYLRKERPDVLIVSLNHNNIVALLAKALSFSKTRVIICQHNALSSEAAEMGTWKYRIVPFLYRWLSPIAHGVMSVSQGVAEDLTKTAHIPAERITVIHNPVITPDFPKRLAASASHAWFDDESIPVFVCVGRLVAQKDHDTLLRALALYRKKAPARLLLLGNGPLEAPLRKLCSELEIADAVDFLGFCNNPLPYMKQASALIMSSRYEGFGNVIVEALGCGTPVISTDCPYGPAEILGYGQFGKLTPVGDPEAMAAAMSPDLRRTWPSEMLQERAQQFTAKMAAKRYMDLIGAT